jgi:hypothetical protein
MTNTAPPGWYPDQTDPGSLRYWDGTAWTEHVAPAQAAPAPPSYAPPGYGAVGYGAPGYGTSTYVAPRYAAGVATRVKPGLVAVWVTAVLSLFTFYVSSRSATGHTSTICLPIGVVFCVACWRLVAKARAECERLHIPLRAGYEAARWTALGLATLSVLASVAAMTR